MTNATTNAAKTMTAGWCEYSVWQRIGVGDDKRMVARLWAHDALDAAHRARQQNGPARYQVRDVSGKRILVGHA